MKCKRQKEFIERLGLVVVIVSVVGMMNIDAETLIIRFISSVCMIVTFGMGLFMFLIPDKLLELQYKSMKHKKVEQR